MKTILILLAAAFLGAALAALVVVSWPQQGEHLSQLFTAMRFPLVLVGLIVLTSVVPPGARVSLGTLTASLVTFAAGIIGGMTLHPQETRNGADVRPDQRPAAPSALVDLLQQPWSSLEVGHVPVAPLLVRCSQLAYESPYQWVTSIPELGFAKHVSLDKGSAKGVVMMVGTEAVIAFQGTDGFGDIGDWFTNLDKKLARPPDDPVHGGFLKAYRSVADQVYGILADNGITHVWITGHSLGGAMAVLCALDLERSHLATVRGVITFGQPLLLEPRFARSANTQLYGRFLRVIHRDDVVPCVVPGLCGGGSSIWFQADGPKCGEPLMPLYGGPIGRNTKVNENEEEGPRRLSDREFERQKAQVRKQLEPSPDGTFQAMPNATDHEMEKYVEAVTEHFGPANERSLTAPAAYENPAASRVLGHKR